MRRVVRTRNDLLTRSVPPGSSAATLAANYAESLRRQADYDSLPSTLRDWLSTFRLGLETRDIHEALRRCNGNEAAAIALLEDAYAKAYPTIVPGTTPQK